MQITINENLNCFFLPHFVSVDYCNPNPCKNRGVCVVEEGKGYSCSCEPGFTGFHCQGNTERVINEYSNSSHH